MWFQKKKKRIYLDHAAATRIADSVWEEMQPYFKETFGNPSAIHQEGAAARRAVEDARTRVARVLQIRPNEVTFTGGGTESNNLALRGHVSALKRDGIASSDIEIIATKVEHPSIMRVLEELKMEGCVVTYVPVQEDGLVDKAAFKAALSLKTRLVSVAYANSETGVVQDLGALGRIIHAFNKEEGTKIVFHTDASQAPLWLPCELSRVQVDMMTLDAGKFGGPKGVGVLAHRAHVALAPVMFGGSQEEGIRPGTENVPLIIGFASAFERAQSSWEARSEAVREVRDYGIEKLLELKGVVLNGSTEHRLPNNINISVPGFDTEYAVVSLDAKGVACSTKSACSGAGSGVSHVLLEMTGDEARAGSTIRLSLGEETTKADIERVVEILKEHMELMAQFKS